MSPEFWRRVAIGPQRRARCIILTDQIIRIIRDTPLFLSRIEITFVYIPDTYPIVDDLHQKKRGGKPKGDQPFFLQKLFVMSSLDDMVRIICNDYSCCSWHVLYIYAY